jgi:uncharacterized protein (DUF2342 family)
MAKKKVTPETDEIRLAEKVRKAHASEEGPAAEALRSLHKRLKRLQRGRRKIATRVKHAQGKKAAAGAKA